MSTRAPITYHPVLDVTRERPHVEVDLGYKKMAFWFDDMNELQLYVIEAVDHDGLPPAAANAVIAHCAERIGSYEDDFDDFESCGRPPRFPGRDAYPQERPASRSVNESPGRISTVVLVSLGVLVGLFYNALAIAIGWAWGRFL